MTIFAENVFKKHLVQCVRCEKMVNSTKYRTHLKSCKLLRGDKLVAYCERYKIPPMLYDKQEYTDYAKKQYDYYNELIFDNKLPKVPIILFQSTERAGCVCYKYRWRSFLPFGNTVFKIRCLKLSYNYINTHEELNDTLLHEMCHVAVFSIDKKDDTCYVLKSSGYNHHGKEWNAWIEHAERITDIEITHFITTQPINYSYLYRCSYNCGCYFYSNMPSSQEQTCCNKCNTKGIIIGSF